MPSPTTDQLLQRAIPHAAQDRFDLADAYGNEGDDAAEAMRVRAAILGLKGKALSGLDEVGLEMAKLTFVYAEQHELALADALMGTEMAASRKSALNNAAQYRKHRLARWGKTRLEAAMGRCVEVPLHKVAELISERQN